VRSEGGLVERLRDHYERLLPRRVGIAVSGGSDSLALLYAAHAWSKDGGGPAIEAVTVDHGLRPEAKEEAAYVRGLCDTLGVPHTTLTWEGWDGKGNLQDQARRNRYALLARWSAARGLDSVALAHTMDDQAETFLMRLARESGVEGMASMRLVFRRKGARFDRPLLLDRRADLRAYLLSRGVRWVDDPSNVDETFDRVKARRAMAALEPLGIGPHELFRVALNLRDASDAIAEVAAQMAREKVRTAGGDLIFDRTALRRQPLEVMRRLLAGALMFVGGSDYPPRRAPLESVILQVETGGNGTLHGCRILVSDMTVRITREHAAVASLRGPTDAPWDGRWRLEGPHSPDLHLAALGEAVKDCPDWRATGLPRPTLLASPAVWRGDALVAAPVAGMANGWSADAPGAADFAAALISH
jgi:tRNA(Ile)-lysidine synthase